MIPSASALSLPATPGSKYLAVPTFEIKFDQSRCVAVQMYKKRSSSHKNMPNMLSLFAVAACGLLAVAPMAAASKHCNMPTQSSCNQQCGNYKGQKPSSLYRACKTGCSQGLSSTPNCDSACRGSKTSSRVLKACTSGCSKMVRTARPAHKCKLAHIAEQKVAKKKPHVLKKQEAKVHDQHSPQSVLDKLQDIHTAAKTNHKQADQHGKWVTPDLLEKYDDKNVGSGHGMANLDSSRPDGTNTADHTGKGTEHMTVLQRLEESKKKREKKHNKKKGL